MHKCFRKNHGSFLRFVPEHSGGWGSPPGLAAGRMAGVSLATKGGSCERSEPIFFLKAQKNPAFRLGLLVAGDAMRCA